MGNTELNGANQSVSIYPNPNTGELSIESEGNANLNLVNELEQMIRKIELKASNNYKIDVSELPNGIYFVTGEAKGSTVRHKIIVRK